jgi:hypothetical protein
VLTKDAYVFAEKRPYTRKIGDVDGNGGFTGVRQHICGGIYVREIVDLCQNCCNDLIKHLSATKVAGQDREGNLQQKYPC